MAASRQARPSNDTDTLALGDKELLLNKKMEEMKLKNEETMRKYKLIERDKLVAEKLGRAVQVAKHGPAPPMKSSKRTEEPSFVNSVITNQSDHRRHTQGSSTVSDHQGRKYNSQKKLESTAAPPPDPTYHFLADRRHINGQQTEVQEKKNSGFKRHPRNYGGNTFESVPQLIEVETGRSGGYCRPIPQTKMEYIICTTGRERHVREEWKKEREKVDQERIDRQKNEHGDWKREWDHEKINQEFDDYPPIVDMSVFSRRMEAGNRSGKIGSGRFTGDHAVSRPNMSTRQGDDDALYEYDERHDLPHGRGRGTDRGQSRAPGRGQWRNQGIRGRGRGQRRSVSKTRQNSFVNNHPMENDRRWVEYENNTLLTKVENHELSDAKPLFETKPSTELRDYTDPRLRTELKHPIESRTMNQSRNSEEIGRSTDVRQSNKTRQPDDRIQSDRRLSAELKQSDKTRRKIDERQPDHQPVPESRPINDVRQMPQSYNEYSSTARRGSGGFRRFADESVNNSQRKEQWNRFMSGSHSGMFEHSRGRGRQQASSNRFSGIGKRSNQRQNFERNKFASKDNNRSSEPNENVYSSSSVASKRNVDRSRNDVYEHVDKKRGVSFHLDEQNHSSNDTEDNVTIKRSLSSIPPGMTLTSNKETGESIESEAKGSQVKPQRQRLTQNNHKLRQRNQVSKPAKENEQSKKGNKPVKESESTEEHTNKHLVKTGEQEQTPTQNNAIPEETIKDKAVEKSPETNIQIENIENQMESIKEQTMRTDCLQRRIEEEHEIMKTAENLNHPIVAELKSNHVHEEPANDTQSETKIMQSNNINILKSDDNIRTPNEISNICINGESNCLRNCGKLIANKNTKKNKGKASTMGFNRKSCEKVLPERSVVKTKEKVDDYDDDEGSWEDDGNWEDVDESMESDDQSLVPESKSDIIIKDLNVASVDSQIYTDTSILPITQLT